MKQKQTAVEWLAEQFDSIVELYPSEYSKINNAIDQAKKMEKEQIKDAWLNSLTKGDYCSAEEYYQSTYGK